MGSDGIGIGSERDRIGIGLGAGGIPPSRVAFQELTQRGRVGRKKERNPIVENSRRFREGQYFGATWEGGTKKENMKKTFSSNFVKAKKI